MVEFHQADQRRLLRSTVCMKVSSIYLVRLMKHFSYAFTIMMLFFLIYRAGIRELASTHPPIVIGYDPSLVCERGIYALSMLG